VLLLPPLHLQACAAARLQSGAQTLGSMLQLQHMKMVLLGLASALSAAAAAAAAALLLPW
jgi:hypothetical protein